MRILTSYLNAAGIKTLRRMPAARCKHLHPLLSCMEATMHSFTIYIYFYTFTIARLFKASFWLTRTFFSCMYVDVIRIHLFKFCLWTFDYIIVSFSKSFSWVIISSKRYSPDHLYQSRLQQSIGYSIVNINQIYLYVYNFRSTDSSCGCGSCFLWDVLKVTHHAFPRIQVGSVAIFSKLHCQLLPFK